MFLTFELRMVKARCRFELPPWQPQGQVSAEWHSWKLHGPAISFIFAG